MIKMISDDALTSTQLDRVTTACARLTKQVEIAKDKTDADALKDLVRPILCRIDVSLYEIRIMFEPAPLQVQLGMANPTSELPGCDNAKKSNLPQITIPVQLKRRGAEMRLVMPGKQIDTKPTNETLIKLVAQAHCWFDDLKIGKVEQVRDIAEREKVHPADASRILPLAFLAPDIITAILNGEQPVDLTPQTLKRLKDLPPRLAGPETHSWIRLIRLPSYSFV